MRRDLAGDREGRPDDPLDGRLGCPAGPAASVVPGVLLADLLRVLLVLKVGEPLKTLHAAGEASEGLGSVGLKGVVDASAGEGSGGHCE